MMVYSVIIWLLAGLLTEGWWLQFICFAVCCYLVMLINNVYALIRIYSRMVSCAFIAFMCMNCFLFPSIEGGLAQVCMAGSLLAFFSIYQEQRAPARSYYAFLLWSLASILSVQVLWLVPLLWIFTYTNLMSLSFRNLAASTLGLLTPYWIWFCWQLSKQDLSPLTDHFIPLIPQGDALLPSTLSIAIPQLVTLVFSILLIIIGIVHFLRERSGDKIRIRMMFYAFIWLDLSAIAILALQPQLYDIAFRLMAICTAPLLGHFAALSHGKVASITFYTVITCFLLITLFNIGVWTI